MIFNKNLKNPFTQVVGYCLLIAEQHAYIMSKLPCRHSVCHHPLQDNDLSKSKNITSSKLKNKFLSTLTLTLTITLTLSWFNSSRVQEFYIFLG